MNSNNNAKVPRSLSSSCLIRTSSECKRKSIPNDPFLKIFTMFSKTPALKPTCHKILASKQQLTQPRIIGHKPRHLIITDPRKLTSNIFKSSTAKLPHKAINPAFTEKHSDKKFTFVDQDQIKTILRGRENTRKELAIQMVKGKIPSLSRKTLKRVNSLVFKDKSVQHKSALDFSFGDHN